MKPWVAPTVTAVLLALVSKPVNASPIYGAFNVAGFADVIFSAANINFLCNAGPLATLAAPCGSGPAGAGNFLVTSAIGDMAPYTNQSAYVKDLGQSLTPYNEPILLSNFLSFSNTAINPVASPDVAFDLRFINLGVSGQAQCGAAAAAGQTCTPAYASLVSAANPAGLSPYNFQNFSAGTSSVSLSVAGDIRRISTNEVIPFIGVYTSHFTLPYQTVLAQILAGGSVNSYSGTFSSVPPGGPGGNPVPEPSAGILLAAGVVLIGIGLARRSVVTR